MIPVAVVLATSALLGMTAAPFAFAESGDSRDKESETNEKLKSGADCNFSGKGNTYPSSYIHRSSRCRRTWITKNNIKPQQAPHFYF